MSNSGKVQTPSIGRVVHYVLSTQDGSMDHKAGEHRPAFIVKIRSPEMVQLQIFTDGSNDRADKAGVIWVTSVHQDEDEKAPRTWHWPEYVP